MLGVGRENKLSPAHAQQIVDSHQPQNPLVIYDTPLSHVRAPCAAHLPLA
jgi:hypothetical protein